MYKNKSYKPGLRIGLSRNDKPRIKSPIRITPTPGVKSRTLGISRSYKTSKHIDNLVTSPILTNTSVNSLPEDVKKSTKKTRNGEAKTKRILEKHHAVVDDNNKKENDGFEGVDKITSLLEQTVAYSPAEVRSSSNYRSKQIVEPVEEKLHNTPKDVEIEDTSISYSPLESTINISKTLKVEKLIVGNPKNTTKNSLKMRKCSRLSLKRSSTMELSDDNSDDIKPFKKKTKLARFQSNTSFASNMSDCSVILDRLSQEIIKTNKQSLNNSNQNNKEFPDCVATEFIDLSKSQEKIDKNSLCNDIISLEQLLKFKTSRLDSLKQSVIYKKKHNVRDLTAVTDVWKNGCKLALKDLLIKSQNVSQSNMTMSDLLMQLNIPEDIFKYDAETDEII